MILAGHIAGIPVEETLASFAPLGAVGVGAVVYGVRYRANRVRRAARERRRRAASARRMREAPGGARRADRSSDARPTNRRIHGRGRS
jgi:hypothetical protein